MDFRGFLDNCSTKFISFVSSPLVNFVLLEFINDYFWRTLKELSLSITNKKVRNKKNQCRHLKEEYIIKATSSNFTT